MQGTSRRVGFGVLAVGLAGVVAYTAVSSNGDPPRPEVPVSIAEAWPKLPPATPVPSDAPVVVALGDSITYGAGANLTAGGVAYPVVLSRLLNASGRRIAVVNAGISGNQLLASSRTGGIATRLRAPQDVFSVPKVKVMVLMIGINDIRNASAQDAESGRTAKELQGAISDLVAEAHRRNIKVIGGTLTPFAGSGSWTPQREMARDQVNSWLRTSGVFDGVVDADRLIGDPEDPAAMLPDFDSGDHLHPSALGYQQIGDAAYPLVLKLCPTDHS